MNTKLFTLRTVFAVALIVLSIAFAGNTASAQIPVQPPTVGGQDVFRTFDDFRLWVGQQDGGMQRPLREQHACWQVAERLDGPVNSEIQYAAGHSGEGQYFNTPIIKGVDVLAPQPRFDFGFATTDANGQIAQGAPNGSYIEGFSRELTAWTECGIQYRKIHIQVRVFVSQTGDEVGAFLNFNGLDVTQVFVKRSWGWEKVCHPDNNFRLDYGGLSTRAPGGNGGARFGFSVHDGLIWAKQATGDEIPYGSMLCPIKLNTGTVVELNLFRCLSETVEFAVFRIVNDGINPINPTTANWSAITGRLW